jgi:hypothetical protein
MGGDAGLDRTGDQGGRNISQADFEPVQHYLGIARLPEREREPLQLLA